MPYFIEAIQSLYPISDETVQALEESVTACRFPRRHRLICANMDNRSA